MSTEIEKKTVFATAVSADGKPMILLGIPQGAWEYMKDGKINHFDFTNAGIEVQLIIFGGKDHATVLGEIKALCAAESLGLRDERFNDADFGIKTPKKTSTDG